jgi:hypothetical protein
VEAQNSTIIAIKLSPANYNSNDDESQKAVNSTSRMLHSEMTIMPTSLGDYLLVHSSNHWLGTDANSQSRSDLMIGGTVQSFSGRTPLGSTEERCVHSGFWSIVIQPYSYDGFESSFGNWMNVSGDNGSWTRDGFGTGTGGTGPASGNSGNYYVYTEASSYSPNHDLFLDLNCSGFDLTTGSVSFAYHMNGSDMGTLRLMVWTGATWESAWSVSGSQGDQWYSTEVSLDAFAGPGRKLRFWGTTGSGVYSDMALDDIAVNIPMSVDVGHYLYAESSSYFSYKEKVHMAAFSLSDPEWAGYACTSNTAQSSTTTTGNAAIITFTPASAGNYLLMASCQVGTSFAANNSYRIKYGGNSTAKHTTG